MNRSATAFINVATVVLAAGGVDGFVAPSGPLQCTPTTPQRWASNQEEPDLFDYFDPLVSPHAYPDGVGPEHKPDPEAAAAAKQSSPRKSPFANPFGIDYMSQKKQHQPEAQEETATTTTTPSSSAAPEDKETPDLFDYFDPLASPHAYPNGIRPPSQQSQPPALELDDRYNPLQMNNNVMTGGTSDSSTTDPRKPKKKIGVLLMDHGSRNPDSNARLERLAELYQLTLHQDDTQQPNNGCEMVVAAAHMEIARPSIPEGLQTLLEAGVEEIVCHPYFLSPGRHVQEDIPQIVAQAMEDLSIDIPIVTTDPVGSNTQVMIGAIHSLVQENAPSLKSRQ